MRNFIYAVGVIWVAVYMGGSAHAIPISESVYTTIYSVENGGSEIEVGDMVHLFDVVYDNEGVVMHDYWDVDDSVFREYTISHYSAYSYFWFDDAAFTLSPFINGLVESYGGADMNDYHLDWTYEFDPPGHASRIVYHTIHDDYRLYFETLESGDSYGVLRVYNDAHSYLQVYFGDPTIIAGGPIDPVPEPATMLLLGAGLVAFTGFRRRIKR